MSDSWALKEVISSKYNRSGSGRCTNRSVLFLIENERTKEISLFYINRVNKMSVSLSCNQRSCYHRLLMKHFMPTEQYGKKANFKFADTVSKGDAMQLENYGPVYHDHHKNFRKTGPTQCHLTGHTFELCKSISSGKVINRKYRAQTTFLSDD